MIQRLVILVLLSAATASAQSTVNVQLTDGIHKWYEPLPVPHRTADRAWWLSTATSAAATVADVEYSMYVIRRPDARELNPLLGSRPNRAQYYAISLPVLGLSTWFSYHYKRQDDALAAAGLPPHKYAKWWVIAGINGCVHTGGFLASVALSRPERRRQDDH